MVTDTIANYLQTKGYGTVGTSMFVGYMPPATSGIVVLDIGNIEPDKYIPTRNPNFEVRIVSSSYEIGRTIVDNIRDELHRKANISLDEYFYYVLATNDGQHLGRDDNGMDIFSISFRTLIRE